MKHGIFSNVTRRLAFAGMAFVTTMVFALHSTPAQASQDPIGWLDLVSSPAPGKIRIRGWTFDRDALNTPVVIHAYVGGTAMAPGTEGHNQTDLGVANGYRPDVNAVYPGAGSYHGFDVTFSTNKTGTQQVCVYAINIGGGNNPMLWGSCQNVTIPCSIQPYGAIGYYINNNPSLGCPINNEYDWAGARAQDTAANIRVVWTNDLGIRLLYGAIGNYIKDNVGSVGLPINSEYDWAGARAQDTTKNIRVVWSNTGLHVLYGAIGNYIKEHVDWWGLPVNDEYDYGGRRAQDTASGVRVIWPSDTGIELEFYSGGKLWKW